MNKARQIECRIYLDTSIAFLPVINKGENIMFHLVDGYSIKGSSLLF